jgi:hypothetical protein
MPYKLVLSLREDFLPHFEGWREAVPALGRVRVRLLPMRGDQALSAVYDGASHLMEPSIARRIVEFVAAAQSSTVSADVAGTASTVPGGVAGSEIEPALLSLFCRGLNERRKREEKSRFDEQLLEGAQESIILDYYRSCVEGLPDCASRFIETELITGKGFRNSYAKDDAVPHYLTQDQLDGLINRRLLRLEERYGTVRIELTHDLLTKAVLERREQRQSEEEKAALVQRAEDERRTLEAHARHQRRRLRAVAFAAVVCLAFAGIAVWQWRVADAARADADAKRVEAEDKQVEAEKARAQADAAKIDADSARVDADTQRSTAEQAQQTAEQQARIAQARELAATAASLDGQRELRVLLGMQSVAVTYATDGIATREAEATRRRRRLGDRASYLRTSL